MFHCVLKIGGILPEMGQSLLLPYHFIVFSSKEAKFVSFPLICRVFVSICDQSFDRCQLMQGEFLRIILVISSIRTFLLAFKQKTHEIYCK